PAVKACRSRPTASTSRSPLPAAAPSMRPLSRNRQVFFLLAWRRLHLPVSVYGGNDCKLSEAARCRDVRLCTVGIIGRPVIHVISYRRLPRFCICHLLSMHITIHFFDTHVGIGRFFQ